MISSDTMPSCQDAYIEKRNGLIADGSIVNGIFVKDCAFDSASTAAGVVGGRSANGRKEWTTLDGRQYGTVIGR